MVGSTIREHPRANEHELLAPTRAELDLLDGAAVRAYVRGTLPELVVHSAGVVGGIQANISEPVRFFSANMMMAINLISASQDAGIPKFLNIGSSCMYPRAAPNPLREEALLTGELEPTNEGYALAKVAGARLCDYVSRQNPQLQYKTIIPCNLYGPHDKFGDNAHMVPAAIAKIHKAIVAGDHSVTIWGNGDARREFMYAGDLAEFVYFALERFESLPGTLNVGVGSDWTISHYYRTIGTILGYRGTYDHDLTKPVGMQRKVVDITRMLALGWKATTTLDEGVRATYRYYLDHEA